MRQGGFWLYEHIMEGEAEVLPLVNELNDKLNKCMKLKNMCILRFYFDDIYAGKGILGIM